MKMWLRSFESRHTAINAMPRGFINASRWCYMNSTIQVLVSIPSFHNLFTRLYGHEGATIDCQMVSALSSLMSQYKTKKNGKVNQMIRNINKETNVNLSDLQEIAVHSGVFEKGVCEDAVEYLTHVLDHLDGEMKMLCYENEKFKTPIVKMFQGCSVNSVNTGTGNRDVFYNLSLDIHIETISCVQEALMYRFGAKEDEKSNIPESLDTPSLNTNVHEANDFCDYMLEDSEYSYDFSEEDEDSASYVSHSSYNDEADNIQAAIAASLQRSYEETPQKDKILKEVIDVLPEILVIQLKRFSFDRETCIASKILRNVDIDSVLDIPEEILSEQAVKKYTGSSRMYSLHAVIYHVGEDLETGHYFCSTMNGAVNEWLCMDDSTITVEKSNPRDACRDTNESPYVLFYRRMDTVSSHYETLNSHFSC